MYEKRHYIRLDVSEKTFLATCLCGWRSDCLTSITAFNRVVAQHRELAENEREHRRANKQPRKYRRP